MFPIRFVNFYFSPRIATRMSDFNDTRLMIVKVGIEYIYLYVQILRKLILGKCQIILGRNKILEYF